MTTGTWHINPDTREVKPCKAQLKCDFGEGTPHFADRTLALQANEAQFKEFEVPQVLKRNVENKIIAGELTDASYAELKKRHSALVHEENDAGSIVIEILANRDRFVSDRKQKGTMRDPESMDRIRTYDIKVAEAYENLESMTKKRLDFLNKHQMSMVEYKKRLAPAGQFSDRTGA